MYILILIAGLMICLILIVINRINNYSAVSAKFHILASRSKIASYNSGSG